MKIELSFVIYENNATGNLYVLQFCLFGNKERHYRKLFVKQLYLVVNCHFNSKLNFVKKLPRILFDMNFSRKQQFLDLSLF